ncbi:MULTISPECIES: hypothetical protein [unclassified Streptomyces]
MLIRKLFSRCVLRDVLLHGETGAKAALFQKTRLNFCWGSVFQPF